MEPQGRGAVEPAGGRSHGEITPKFLGRPSLASILERLVKDKEAFIELMRRHDLLLLRTAQSLSQSPAQQPSGLRKYVHQKILEEMRASAGAGELANRLAPVYEEHFSSEEMQDLLYFLGSPLGRKFLSLQPQTLHGVGLATAVWTQEVADAMRSAFGHFVRGVLFHERGDLHRAVLGRFPERC